MTTTTMPTSGSARRRAKAQRNRAKGYELEAAEALRNAIAVSICPCGRRAWLMPGATDEEHGAFDRDNADHDAPCPDVYGGAW